MKKYEIRNKNKKNLKEYEYLRIISETFKYLLVCMYDINIIALSIQILTL
jgi:hypothetical protein